MKKKPEMVLVTGFLGAGKTTMMLKLIDYFQRLGKRCAIIINEIGEEGIDNRKMRAMGYDVLDLFGGCVCCTLKVTLEATIHHLLNEAENIDVILFEPSGMGEASSMIDSIENCGYQRSEIINCFIVDPLRIALYQKRLNKLFLDGVGVADIVLISKMDVVVESDFRIAEKMIDEVDSNLPCLGVDFISHRGEEQITKWLERRMGDVTE